MNKHLAIKISKHPLIKRLLESTDQKDIARLIVEELMNEDEEKLKAAKETIDRNFEDHGEKKDDGSMYSGISASIQILSNYKSGSSLTLEEKQHLENYLEEKIQQLKTKISQFVQEIQETENLNTVFEAFIGEQKVEIVSITFDKVGGAKTPESSGINYDIKVKQNEEETEFTGLADELYAEISKNQTFNDGELTLKVRKEGGSKSPEDSESQATQEPPDGGFEVNDENRKNLLVAIDALLNDFYTKKYKIQQAKILEVLINVLAEIAKDNQKEVAYKRLPSSQKGEEATVTEAEEAEQKPETVKSLRVNFKQFLFLLNKTKRALTAFHEAAAKGSVLTSNMKQKFMDLLKELQESIAKLTANIVKFKSQKTITEETKKEKEARADELVQKWKEVQAAYDKAEIAALAVKKVIEGGELQVVNEDLINNAYTTAINLSQHFPSVNPFSKGAKTKEEMYDYKNKFDAAIADVKSALQIVLTITKGEGVTSDAYDGAASELKKFSKTINEIFQVSGIDPKTPAAQQSQSSATDSTTGKTDTEEEQPSEPTSQPTSQPSEPASQPSEPTDKTTAKSTTEPTSSPTDDSTVNLPLPLPKKNKRIAAIQGANEKIAASANIKDQKQIGAGNYFLVNLMDKMYSDDKLEENNLDKVKQKTGKELYTFMFQKMGDPNVNNWRSFKKYLEALNKANKLNDYLNLLDRLIKGAKSISDENKDDKKTDNTISDKELEQIKKGKVRNLKGRDLSGADLSKASLTFVNLIEANLSGANLSGANLTDSFFSNANLSKADLSGAILVRAMLNGTDLRGAIFNKTNLTDAFYDDETQWPEGFNPENNGMENMDSDLEEIETNVEKEVEKAKKDEEDITKPEVQDNVIQNVVDSISQETDLPGEKVEKIVAAAVEQETEEEQAENPFSQQSAEEQPEDPFSQQSAEEKEEEPFEVPKPQSAKPSKEEIEKFKKGELKDLRGKDLTGVDLSDAKLNEANLSEANLSEAKLEYAKLNGANLSKAYLSGADLSDSQLMRANLSKADLSKAKLQHADLSRANLNGADLSGADLTQATLKQADLSKANLSDAILKGALFTGATYDGQTKWPSEFDVSESGATNALEERLANKLKPLIKEMLRRNK